MCVAGTGRSGGRGGFAPLGARELVVQYEDGFLQARGAELEFGHRESIQVKPRVDMGKGIFFRWNVHGNCRAGAAGLVGTRVLACIVSRSEVSSYIFAVIVLARGKIYSFRSKINII